ncbi:MAG TPA: sulfatase, partial [Candidatus Handelsmanbacteria bacterium]|nr:sulfatase [Candidatus Handelsmanbacteria bacterium]
MSSPNVLFILTDDQGPWATGCSGNDEIRTPGIDRIAATGIRFEHFLCASPVCSPSRASFLTGRMPSQHGVHDWIREGNTGPDAATYLEDEVTYTDVLATHGYNVGLSGKWHLGNSQLVQNGYSHWYVHQRGGGDYNDAPMIREGKLIDEPGYVTNRITDDALDFLDRQATDQTQEATPFYLGVHYTAPHSPWTGHPQDIVDSYADCAFESCPQEPIHPWAKGHGLSENCLGKRDTLQGYFAAVTAMDLDVLRLLDRLATLGLRDNTLV